MSKYGDDYSCTCEMNLVSCRNDLHAGTCELWQEPSFVSGLDEWDSDLGCLTLSQSPWSRPEEFVWDGDNPVVRNSTQTALGEAVAEWELVEQAKDERHISDLEQEVMDALTAGTATTDATGLISLDDGSYADFDLRVTYRKTLVGNDPPQWVEAWWDGYAPEDAPTLGTDALDCDCTPAKRFYCSIHNVQRDTETGPWRWWGGHSNTTGTVQYTYTRCNHVFETFELPGLQHENIKVSGKRYHGAQTTPDHGLYAYTGWDPDCVATFIPWQDYGLPKCSYVQAAEAIKAAYDLADSGKIVEVGCMGGHGRTGTILGCMAILSDPEMSAKQAVSHVRKVHCNEAIETNEQEWFVAWFRAWLLDEPSPAKPTTYVSKHSANWAAAGAAATAIKDAPLALPKAQSSPSPSGGAATNSYKTVWCDSCKRMIYTTHNTDCPFFASGVTELQFDPQVIEGETANARRRNAKRANRRASRKANRAAGLRSVQEYI